MRGEICVGLRGARRSLSLDLSGEVFLTLKRFGGPLECVFLPGWLQEVPASCFRNSSLSRVTFGSGSLLKRIGEGAFSECEELRELEIPASVEEIGGWCFSCSSLSRVTFGSGSRGVLTIRKYARIFSYLFPTAGKFLPLLKSDSKNSYASNRPLPARI